MSTKQTELRLPNLDVPGMAVTVCSWHVKVGQRVVEGDRLVEILAGDATIDLGAPASGVLIVQCAEIDDGLAVGQLLAVIAEE